MTREQLENAIKAIDRLKDLLPELLPGQTNREDFFRDQLNHLQSIGVEALYKTETICLGCKFSTIHLRCSAAPKKFSFVIGREQDQLCEKINTDGKCQWFQKK